MYPLSLAGVGQNVVIKNITGKDEVKSHLAEMGFVADTGVELVADNGGNVIVKVRGSRVALDKSMAMRVMVQ